MDNNKVLLYSTEIQYPVIKPQGKGYFKKKYIYIYKLKHFAVQQKLTQHCKSTIPKKKEPRFRNQDTSGLHPIFTMEMTIFLPRVLGGSSVLPIFKTKELNCWFSSHYWIYIESEI